jgi:hypothetical protein
LNDLNTPDSTNSINQTNSIVSYTPDWPAFALQSYLNEEYNIINDGKRGRVLFD